MKNKLTRKEKLFVKEAAKTVVLYVAFGIALDKALDYYIKH